jgi:hypothetical protein
LERDLKDKDEHLVKLQADFNHLCGIKNDQAETIQR